MVKCCTVGPAERGTFQENSIAPAFQFGEVRGEQVFVRTEIVLPMLYPQSRKPVVDRGLRDIKVGGAGFEPATPCL